MTEPKKGPATNDELGQLHNELAGILLKAIHEKEPKVVELPDAEAESGKKKVAVMVTIASVLNVARAFLKDNEIKGVAAKGTNLGKLAKAINELPTPGEELEAFIHGQGSSTPGRG